ncbi:hypothetical protein ACIA5D_49235 [Actinoplanes sp. NPDC051513]|uniref:hypothetical protein n=1 Tax=Actinoplanes sp. NPDC051513 TaxID=3363908 RepID=UPI003799FEBF
MPQLEGVLQGAALVLDDATPASPGRAESDPGLGQLVFGPDRRDRGAGANLCNRNALAPPRSLTEVARRRRPPPERATA